MFKGVLALTATAVISLAVFANSASAEDLTKFYSTERVSGYKSGEFMILAEVGAVMIFLRESRPFSILSSSTT